MTKPASLPGTPAARSAKRQHLQRQRLPVCQLVRLFRWVLVIGFGGVPLAVLLLPAGPLAGLSWAGCAW